MKNILIGLFIVIVFVIAGLLSLPFLVDLASYQDQYKPLIEDALNRKIELQSIRLTIWPRIGARVVGFTVMDDPSFSATPFASLSSLDVGVKLLPLLSKQVEIEEITLHDPLITVIKNKDGITNLSTLGPRTAAPAAPEKPQPQQGDPLQALALLAVDRVSIDGGTLMYHDLSAAAKAGISDPRSRLSPDLGPSRRDAHRTSQCDGPAAWSSCHCSMGASDR